MKKTHKNTFLWVTEEWLIVLIAILILLAIAIGAAGARTLINPNPITQSQALMGASATADDTVE